MSNFQISFVFNADTETVSDLTVKAVTKKEAVRKKSPSNTNSKIFLNGASLALTEDVLDYLRAKVESKLVLTVKDDKALLSNPKIVGGNGGNRVTGKLTIACRGKIKDELEALGQTFGFKEVSTGVIELIPLGEGDEVVQITEEVDDVITDEDIKVLIADGDEEELDDFNLDNL